MSIVYSTISEDSTSYTGKLVISNPNTSYTWNGTYFAIWSIAFDCTSTITSATNPDGAILYNSENGVVTMDLGWQSLFPYGKSVTVTIQANKAGTKVYPQNPRTNYVHGKDIIYPEYRGLPATWSKGKVNLTAADLIANPTQYYSATVSPVTDTFIMYNPPHPTQIMIGQPLDVDYPVNGRDNTRMWIPTPYMAMGFGFSYEWFKINPNYTAALGTKENWAAGVIPYDPGFPGITVQIDGQNWIWGIAIDHSDGPFQQEAPNFNEAVKYFPDYYPPGALHANYDKVSLDLKNPNWISSAISSAISTTVTREVLNACKDTYYNDFMAQAKDPWAEFVIITLVITGDLVHCMRESFSQLTGPRPSTPPIFVRTLTWAVSLLISRLYGR